MGTTGSKLEHTMVSINKIFYEECGARLLY